MSEKNTENVASINILDRNYKIRCQPEEVKDLQLAAEYLNDKMQQFRKNSNMSSPDGLAIITALNVVNELMLLKKQKNDYAQEVQVRISSLKNKIEKFLETQAPVAV